MTTGHFTTDLVLDSLPKLAKSDVNIKAYIDSAFGGVDNCRKIILADFCRHAARGDLREWPDGQRPVLSTDARCLTFVCSLMVLGQTTSSMPDRALTGA